MFNNLIQILRRLSSAPAAVGRSLPAATGVLAAIISLAQIYISVRQSKIEAGNAAIDEFYSLAERRRFTGSIVVALWREGADETQARKAYDEYTTAFTDQQVKRFNVLNYARGILDGNAAAKSPEYLAFERIYEERLVGCLLGPQRDAIFRSFTCRYSTSLNAEQIESCANASELLREVPVRGRCFTESQNRVEAESRQIADITIINRTAVSCLAAMRDYLAKRNDEQRVLLGVGGDLSSVISGIFGIFGYQAPQPLNPPQGEDPLAAISAQCTIDSAQARTLAAPRQRTLPDSDLPAGP